MSKRKNREGVQGVVDVWNSGLVPTEAEVGVLVARVNAYDKLTDLLSRVSQAYGSRNLPGNEGKFERLIDEINEAIK